MASSKTTRFSVSMPEHLVQRLDRMMRAHNYANRSQLVARLVRDALLEDLPESETTEIAGTITLVYDHHKPNLQTLLTSIQHDHHAQIISTLHVHLDHDNCLEVLVVRGPAEKVRIIADELIAAKGVKHGRLVLNVSGSPLP